MSSEVNIGEYPFYNHNTGIITNRVNLNNEVVAIFAGEYTLKKLTLEGYTTVLSGSTPLEATETVGGYYVELITVKQQAKVSTLTGGTGNWENIGDIGNISISTNFVKIAGNQLVYMNVTVSGGKVTFRTKPSQASAKDGELYIRK